VAGLADIAKALVIETTVDRSIKSGGYYFHLVTFRNQDIAGVMAAGSLPGYLEYLFQIGKNWLVGIS
jgi:hypothetical protein